MQFKQYPSYKNSGVEWLGDVPEHWDLKRFKYILEEVNERSELGDETLLSVSEYYGVKPRKETIDEGDILSRAESLSGYKKCKSGDLVMNIMLAWKRGLGITKFDGIVSPAYAVFRLFSHNYSEDYIHYLLRTDTYTNYFKSFSTGVMDSRLRLYPEYFGNLTNISPSLKEQNQIVSFLDTETARIDNLIAKQEKLIELLEEQRKSIISHAVTKGLDPNAPMKDSGVEWLGEVPEHWVVLKNIHLLNFSTGLSITKANLQESGIPCVSYGEVHSKLGFEFNPEVDDVKFVSDEYLSTSRNCLLNQGDFVFADTSEDFEGSGNFSYLNSKTQAFAGYHTVIARLKSNQNPRFLAYVFDSNAHRKQIQTLVKGIKVFSITQTILKDVYSWIPPIVEQNQIVEVLDGKCKNIDELISKQNGLIENLKEYRSSIISHAVTGKIDVREHAE